MPQSGKRSPISGHPSSSPATPSSTTAYESYESRSPVQRQALALTRLYAANNRATIVFEGESGTGKTLIASYAHSISGRASGPFKWLSLAAIDESLAPSELFGHVEGAFTDARKDRPGAIASASHGTLFLDEIGKASPRIQQLLLRAVEALAPPATYKEAEQAAKTLLVVGKVLDAVNTETRDDLPTKPAWVITAEPAAEQAALTTWQAVLNHSLETLAIARRTAREGAP